MNPTVGELYAVFVNYESREPCWVLYPVIFPRDGGGNWHHVFKQGVCLVLGFDSVRYNENLSTTHVQEFVILTDGIVIGKIESEIFDRMLNEHPTAVHTAKKIT